MIGSKGSVINKTDVSWQLGYTMQIGNVELLPMGALRIGRYVVIADLHLGFEEYMSKRGVYLPPLQLKRALEVLRRLPKSKTLVIAGDIKHSFEGLGRHEKKDVISFLDEATKKFDEVILIKGNHDTFIKPILSEFGVDFADELKDGNLVIIHGHEMLKSDAKTIIMGHEHPSITLRDQLGVAAKFPCFLHVPLADGREVIVLPSVGAYQSGTSVTLDKRGYLSPIIRELGIIEESVPYVIDEELGVLEFPKLKLMIDMIVNA